MYKDNHVFFINLSNNLDARNHGMLAKILSYIP